MNTPAYRKAYMANLKLETSNNAKNLKANLATPALAQYTAAGNVVLGGPTYKAPKKK